MNVKTWKCCQYPIPISNWKLATLVLATLATMATFAKTFDVDISTERPAASNEAYYHGETIEFRAVRGRSVVTNVEYSCVYYQTNGMDSVWWHTDGLVFHPTNDVGAASYRFFLEGRDDLGRDWHANGLLRLLPSPGFTPNTIELPVARLDFAAVEVANAPWTDPDYSTNNTELVETIEATAPAPGNYAAVSNAAVYAAITNALQDAAIESNRVNIASNRVAISTLSDSKLDKSGGTMTGQLTINATNTLPLFLRVPPVPGSTRRPALSFDYDNFPGNLRWRLGIGYDDSYPDHVIYLPQASGTLALTSDIAGKQDNLPYPTNAIPYAAISGKPSLATVATSGSYNDLSNKPTIPTVPTNVSAFNNDAGYLTSYTETDPTISSWAKAASKPTYTADEVGAVSSNKIEEVRTDNAQTRQIVTTWENFLDGSNVVFSITNYLSGSYNLDAAKLRILELREGEYHEVFNSRDEILLHIENFRTNDFRVATNELVGAVNEAIGGKADRDWGKYTSAGGDAPANTVYMTAPNTVFAGGLEYERVAVGEGTICVLTTRGAPTWTQGDEGTFKFQDDGGTNYFGFAKTDSYTIGANTDGITVQGGMVTMNYNITMSGRPCVWYKSSLSSGAWEQLNLPDGSPVAGASHAVTWEANPDPGTQVCYINVGNQPSGFFKATVEVTGEAKFMTNMPADMSGGIVCPNTATGVSGVIKPTFDGTSVIWTWSAK